MAPKEAKTSGTTAKAPSHPSYKDMIKDAILALKERNGSSRQAIKKYILANHKPNATDKVFDQQINKAVRSGVEKGEFTQPKGSSGPVKLAKKEAKPATKKATTTKKTTTAAKPKTTTTATKKAAPKTTKAATTKKTATAKKPAAKPKANTSTKRKTPTAAPAVVDPPKVLNKTKSGRVTKTNAGAPTAKKAAAKKATPKKAASAAKA